MVPPAACTAFRASLCTQCPDFILTRGESANTRSTLRSGASCGTRLHVHAAVMVFVAAKVLCPVSTARLVRAHCNQSHSPEKADHVDMEIFWAEATTKQGKANNTLG